MKSSLLRVSSAVAFALLGVMALGIFVSYAAPAEDSRASSSPTSNPVMTDSPASIIVARRIISIPFGVDAPLQISPDGAQIDVTGHGTCPEGATTFRIRATVSQASTSARAISHFTEHECPPTPGDGTDWATLAEAKGPKTFNAGTAQVCIMVHFNSPDEPTTVFKWCYQDVALISQ